MSVWNYCLTFYTLMPIAQATAVVDQDKTSLLGYHLVAAIVFSLLGIAVLFSSIWMMERCTRFSISKEIVDEHNTALAIIVGAIVIGISLIIAASISG